MMSRIRSYQDREFWGTAGHPRHGMKPEKDFDYYIRQRIVFDVAGFCGGITSVQAGLLEIPASHMVFGTDYPQEIRTREDVRDYVSQIRKLGKDGQRILSGNNGLLLKKRSSAEKVDTVEPLAKLLGRVGRSRRLEPAIAGSARGLRPQLTCLPAMTGDF